MTFPLYWCGGCVVACQEQIEEMCGCDEDCSQACSGFRAAAERAGGSEGLFKKFLEALQGIAPEHLAEGVDADQKRDEVSCHCHATKSQRRLTFPEVPVSCSPYILFFLILQGCVSC